MQPSIRIELHTAGWNCLHRWGHNHPYNFSYQFDNTWVDILWTFQFKRQLYPNHSLLFILEVDMFECGSGSCCYTLNGTDSRKLTFTKNYDGSTQESLTDLVLVISNPLCLSLGFANILAMKSGKKSLWLNVVSPLTPQTIHFREWSAAHKVRSHHVIAVTILNRENMELYLW